MNIGNSVLLAIVVTSLTFQWLIRTNRIKPSKISRIFYNEDLAKGGTDVIITGGTFITEDSKSLPVQIGFYNDEFIIECIFNR